MRMCARTCARWWPLLGLLGVLPACAAGAEATAPPKAAPTSQPQLSPEEQAAKDLIQRFKAESKVKQEQDQHLAEQHFQTGKAHFDQGAWQLAYDHFRKATQLDPTNKQAQDYLRRAAGLLGLKEGPARLIDDYVAIERVRVEARQMELRGLFAKAKAAYEKGQFLEAMELFIRVKALALSLAPYCDTAKVADDAEQQIGKAKAAVGEQRIREDQERRRRAQEEADRLRKQGQSQAIERKNAQLAQAGELVEGRRYDEARKLCDAVLRGDPGNATATALWERAHEAARTEALDRALRSRAVEVAHWDQQLSALAVPQNDTIAISRARLDDLRHRKAETVFGADLGPPEDWEKRIRERLESKVTFDFIETPLCDVVSFLSTLTDVSMVLDTEALKASGMPNVSLRVQDMRLEAALNWICKLVGLRYALRDEAIFLSKPERVYETPVLRMYDITDLTIEIKNFKGRQRALATDSGLGAQSNLLDFFGDEEKEEADKPLSGPALIDFLKQIAAPVGPEDDGGMGRLREVAGLPRDERVTKGQELVDLIGITVGGRTFLGVKTRE